MSNNGNSHIIQISTNLTNSNSKEIYFFLNELRMKTTKLNDLISNLFKLQKIELKHIIMFKYYINHIIVHGNSSNLKAIYDTLLKLLQNGENNKYKDYIFALLYYIIIEQKSYKKNNKKPVFTSEQINNEFKKYIMSENNSNNLSIPVVPLFNHNPNLSPDHPPVKHKFSQFTATNKYIHKGEYLGKYHGRFKNEYNKNIYKFDTKNLKKNNNIEVYNKKFHGNIPN
jgi:hypothetical protein